MPSPDVIIAVEAFRKAFERAEALGVNVMITPFALPYPKGPVRIDMKYLSFKERESQPEVLEERATSV